MIISDSRKGQGAMKGWGAPNISTTYNERAPARAVFTTHVGQPAGNLYRAFAFQPATSSSRVECRCNRGSGCPAIKKGGTAYEIEDAQERPGKKI